MLSYKCIQCVLCLPCEWVVCAPCGSCVTQPLPINIFYKFYTVVYTHNYIFFVLSVILSS